MDARAPSGRANGRGSDATRRRVLDASGGGAKRRDECLGSRGAACGEVRARDVCAGERLGEVGEAPSRPRSRLFPLAAVRSGNPSNDGPLVVHATRGDSQGRGDIARGGPPSAQTSVARRPPSPRARSPAPPRSTALGVGDVASADVPLVAAVRARRRRARVRPGAGGVVAGAARSRSRLGDLPGRLLGRRVAPSRRRRLASASSRSDMATLGTVGNLLGAALKGSVNASIDQYRERRAEAGDTRRTKAPNCRRTFLGSHLSRK